jgi:uncharacterized protein (TIGR02646 family)
MIKIDRNKVPIPDILTNNPKKRGFKETAKAILYYDVPEPDKLKSYKKFKIYGTPEVKGALIKLFNGKCAYCESTFLHVYIGDVEHFRPKGAIKIGDNLKKPGYYWLAADWDNLLLSCRNCNQKSKQFTFGESVKNSIGKMNQFPLSDESKRVRKHNHSNGIEQEEPVRLIINPCKENPENYFKYSTRTGVILPKSRAKHKKNMAKNSIEVFALQRVPLVQERERKAIEIKAQMQRIKQALKNVSEHLDNNDRTIKRYYNRILKKELKKLYNFLSVKEEYVGLARQMINKFLETNFGIT